MFFVIQKTTLQATTYTEECKLNGNLGTSPAHPHKAATRESLIDIMETCGVLIARRVLFSISATRA
jgi:hypothetical protein